MKLSAVLLLIVAAPAATAFAPLQQPQTRHHVRESVVALEMANGERRARVKKALKRVGKVAGAVGAATLATTTVAPQAALAKDTFEVSKKGLAIAAGAVALVGGFIALSGPGAGTSALQTKLDTVFPGALQNGEFVKKVKTALGKYDFGSTSLCATSLCADEVNRVLEKDLSKVYTDNFNMGGLAGFPFGGVTAFGAMASHIPDGGSCLVVYGPHVGLDADGSVGTVERRGRANGGACCGSAVAASKYVASVNKGDIAKASPPSEPNDAQQNFVGNLLLPYASRLDSAPEPMVELPYCLYEAQKELMTTIVKAGSGAVAGDGKIGLIGGIQINTPPGTTDYFLPLSFDVYNNKGDMIDDLLPKL